MPYVSPLILGATHINHQRTTTKMNTRGKTIWGIIIVKMKSTQCQTSFVQTEITPVLPIISALTCWTARPREYPRLVVLTQRRVSSWFAVPLKQWRKWRRILCRNQGEGLSLQKLPDHANYFRFPDRNGKARKCEDRSKLCSRWKEKGCRLDRHVKLSRVDPLGLRVSSVNLFDFMQVVG